MRESPGIPMPAIEIIYDIEGFLAAAINAIVPPSLCPISPMRVVSKPGTVFK